MSQLNHGSVPTPQQQAQSQAGAHPAEEQQLNDEAATARHLTAIRIRGQLADAEGETGPG